MPTYTSALDVYKRRGENLEKMRSLAEKAQAEKRDFTQPEQQEWDSLLAAEDRMKKDHARFKTLDDLPDPGKLKTLATPVERTFRTTVDRPEDHGWGEPTPRFMDADGDEIRSYRPDEQLSVPSGYAGEPLSVGRCLRALLIGDTDNLSGFEKRAMLAGLDTSGNYLLSPMLSTRFVDMARSASVSLRAGALTVEMEGPELAIARVTGDPTTSWRSELVAVAGSSPSFDRVILKPKTLACLVPISLEMAEDLSNGPAVLEQILQGAMGAALDKAVLRGAGNSAEPMGIRNVSGTNLVTSVGAFASYAKFSTSVQKILEQNFDGEPNRLSWVMHPRDWGRADALLDTTNQPLNAPPFVAALRRFSTTSLNITEGAGANESSAIVGDFSQILIGFRTRGAVIRVLEAGTAVDSDGQTVNAASQLAKLVVCHLRADVAVMRPAWFSIASGIL